MLLTCPNCQAECSTDNAGDDTVTCSKCGHPLSSHTAPASPEVNSSDILLADPPTSPTMDAGDWNAGDLSGVSLGLHGRYLVLSSIAKGGFARVYLARDNELGRQIALKIPLPHKFRSPDQLRRFLDEARLAAKLRHPGIVTIFDIGKFENGTNYIAMEYVAGQPLSELMKAGRVPVQRAVELLISIAEAIHEAHHQGVVHRDLKPSNILLDERGRPRVVDFGLAVHESGQDSLQGEFAGTPAFMSPEQFRGEAHRLDGRTDLWSLGVVMYQLLTNRRPFQGELAQLRDEVLNKSPKPLRQIDDQIPPGLETICLKCLSKSVDARYTTAKDLMHDLQQQLKLLTDASDRSQLPLHVPVAPAPQRKRQLVLMAMLLVTAVLGSFGIASLVMNRGRLPDKPGPKVAPEPEPKPKPLDDEPLLRAVALIDRQHVPKKLSWPFPGVDDSFDYQLDEGRLTLHNRSPAFVELGTTTASAIAIEAELSRTGDRGTNGLFWGWEPDQKEPDHFYCFTAAISSAPARNGKVDGHVAVQLLRLKQGQQPGHYAIVETAGLASQPMDPKSQLHRGRLTVTVSSQLGLQSVAWDGHILGDIPENAQAFLASQPTRFPKMRSAGVFGIFNRQGAVLVRNPTVKLISRGEH